MPHPRKPQPPASARELMATGPVIAVISIARVADAIPLARALIAGGVRVLEATLRTDAALAAIREMKSVPGAIVGAGTVLSAHDVTRATEAGVGFLVSPGLTDALADAAAKTGLPFLPGVASPSDVMRGIERGFECFKFFPAESCGGVAALKALAGPFPKIRFSPSGGITGANAQSYLALPNVACIGGSWLASQADIDAGDWDAITKRAREAASFASPAS